jgi:hypothetical protein
MTRNPCGKGPSEAITALRKHDRRLRNSKCQTAGAVPRETESPGFLDWNQMFGFDGFSEVIFHVSREITVSVSTVQALDLRGIPVKPTILLTVYFTRLLHDIDARLETRITTKSASRREFCLELAQELVACFPDSRRYSSGR